MGTREFTESEVGYWTGELIESEVTDQMRLWGSYSIMWYCTHLLAPPGMAPLVRFN